MATYTKEWVTYDVNSGGIIGTPSQDSIQFTAESYTGRNERQLTFTITADNPSTADAFSKNFYIKQTGKPLYVTFRNKAFTITNSTRFIVIEGNTNSPFISIDTSTEDASAILGHGRLAIEKNSATSTDLSVTIEDLNRIHYNKIPNDPGATNSYNFTIKVPIPENPDITTQRVIEYEIIIGEPSSDNLTINNRLSYIIRVSQGYDYTLNVTPETLEFNSDGGTQSVTVTSNVNWTIS